MTTDVYYLLRNLSVDDLATLPIQNIIENTKDAAADENIDNVTVYAFVFCKIVPIIPDTDLFGVLGLFGMDFFGKMEKASSKYQHINEDIFKCCTQILNTLKTRLDPVKQPIAFKSEEIVVPLVIAHHLTDVFHDDNMRKWMKDVFRETIILYNPNVTIRPMPNDLDIISTAIHHLSQIAKIQHAAQDIKSMAASIKLIAKLTKHIWPTYAALGTETAADDQSDCNHRTASCMAVICSILSDDIQSPSTLSALVTYKIRIFLIDTISSMYQNWDKLFLVGSFNAFADLFRVIDDAFDAKSGETTVNEAAQQNLYALRSNCLSIWSRMLQSSEINCVTSNYSTSEMSLEESIGVLRLALQTNEHSISLQLSVATFEAILVHGERAAHKFASIGTRSELLDDFIAVAAAVFIKSTNMKEWYGALDIILTRGILSMGFLRAYASYNILVIFLKRCSTVVQLKYFSTWKKIQRHLMPVTGNVTYTFVGKLVRRIFEMLPDAHKNVLVRKTLELGDQIGHSLPVATDLVGQDLELANRLLANEIADFHQYLTSMLRHDDWQTMFSGSKWIRLIEMSRNDLHNKKIYPHYRQLLNDSVHTGNIKSLLTAAIATKSHAIQAMLYPLLISQHINCHSDAERNEFVQHFRTNEACHELISYTLKIVRANDTRTKDELSNLSLLLRAAFQRYRYSRLVNERLIQLQCVSSSINQDELNVVVPVYVDVADPKPIGKSHLFSERGWGCNWRECFLRTCDKTAATRSCDKTAAEEFRLALERVKVDVNRMKQLLVAKDRGVNICLEEHIDDIEMIREAFNAFDELVNSRVDSPEQME